LGGGDEYVLETHSASHQGAKPYQGLDPTIDRHQDGRRFPAFLPWRRWGGLTMIGPLFSVLPRGFCHEQRCHS
jgi:hypothetical protein